LTFEQLGPNLGRPAVDSIKSSRHHNMKELRSVGGNLRALFCFDPRRTAIVLLGGDKSNDWVGWYAATSHWPTNCMTNISTRSERKD
jgi:hypothetical protein